MFTVLKHLLPRAVAFLLTPVSKFIRLLLEGLIKYFDTFRVVLDDLFDTLWPEYTDQLKAWINQFGFKTTVSTSVSELIHSRTDPSRGSVCSDGTYVYFVNNTTLVKLFTATLGIQSTTSLGLSGLDDICVNNTYIVAVYRGSYVVFLKDTLAVHLSGSFGVSSSKSVTCNETHFFVADIGNTNTNKYSFSGSLVAGPVNYGGNNAQARVSADSTYLYLAQYYDNTIKRINLSSLAVEATQTVNNIVTPYTNGSTLYALTGPIAGASTFETLGSSMATISSVTLPATVLDLEAPATIIGTSLTVIYNMSLTGLREMTDTEKRSLLTKLWAEDGGQDPAYLIERLTDAGFVNFSLVEWWEWLATTPPTAKDPELVISGATSGGYVLVNKITRLRPNWLMLAGDTDTEAGESHMVAGNYDRYIYEEIPYELPTDSSYWPKFLYIVFSSTTWGGTQEDLDKLLLRICPLDQWIIVVKDY